MADKPWVVLKYGGTSVSSVKTWETILARVEALLPTNRVWIVVSALSKVRSPRPASFNSPPPSPTHAPRARPPSTAPGDQCAAGLPG